MTNPIHGPQPPAPANSGNAAAGTGAGGSSPPSPNQPPPAPAVALAPGQVSANPPSWVRFTPAERRVVGTLIEKAKTTPDLYPLTITALVTGCNQKTNRHPIVNYDADDVDDILIALRKKGAVLQIDAGGRVPRFKHTLYEWLRVDKIEIAVVAELLLRGPQTEGDLRSRINRMNERDPVNDLPALQAILQRLRTRGLIEYLTPPEVKRGAIVTHTLYPEPEWAKIQAEWSSRTFSESDHEADEPASAAHRAHPASPAAAAGRPQPQPAASIPPAIVEEINQLHQEMQQVKTILSALQGQLSHLEDEFKSLKNALGD